MKDNRIKNKASQDPKAVAREKHWKNINGRGDVRAIQFLLRSPSNPPAMKRQLPYPHVERKEGDTETQAAVRRTV